MPNRHFKAVAKRHAFIAATFGPTEDMIEECRMARRAIGRVAHRSTTDAKVRMAADIGATKVRVLFAVRGERDVTLDRIAAATRRSPDDVVLRACLADMLDAGDFGVRSYSDGRPATFRDATL